MEKNLMKIRTRLTREGWQKRDGGKHYIFIHPDKPGKRVVVAKGRGELATGTAKAIHDQAGW